MYWHRLPLYKLHQMFEAHFHANFQKHWVQKVLFPQTDGHNTIKPLHQLPEFLTKSDDPGIKRGLVER